jgi:hypothetical protein
MALDKVQPGDGLAIPAETYNAMIDAAADYQARARSMGGGGSGKFGYGVQVRVRNNTGTDLGRFNIVGLGTMVISDEDNESEFFSTPTFEAEIPVRTASLNYSQHVGKLGICQGAIPKGFVGWVKVAGVSPVKIDIVNDHDDIGIAQDGNTTELKSWTGGETGPSILWHKPATTGVQWSLCLLGNHRSKFASMYRAKLTGSLAETDASISVDTLVPMDGLQHLDTDAITAHNVFSWSGSDDADCLLAWNNHVGFERWELIQLDCS